MMHYGWLHSGVLESHRYYPRYMEQVPNLRHRNDHRDDENDQTGDEIRDTATSGTSVDRSSSADLFRLEFAAAQWSKLVSNAEGLFTKLMTTNVLPHPEQDQIEQWLCLKQEYEECIASDDASSLPGLPENTRRSLERIEEVTETDEKTDESANRTEFRTASCSSTESEMSEEYDEEEEEQSDGDSENPDFLERLDELMSKFKTETDEIIDSKEEGIRETNLAIISTTSVPVNNNNDYVPIIKPIPIRNPNSRRNSMLPGSEMCNEVMAFNGTLRPCQNKNYDDNSTTIFNNGNFTDNRESDFRNVHNDNVSRMRKDNSPDLLIDALKTNETPEPIKALKTLTMNNEAKQTQMKQMQSELDEAHRHIEKLKTTIKIKKCFIADMIKNSETRSSVQQRCQRKHSKVVEEYDNTKKQLAQAENASMYEDSDERSNHKKAIERYRKMVLHYEKKLKGIAKIQQIADDSAKKVFELEGSLHASKKQMDKLYRQCKKTEEQRNQLSGELALDQKKIRDLEEKCNLTTDSKPRELQQSESEDERNAAKPKNNCSDKKKNFLEVSARLSHLDHVLNEKSMDLERTADKDAKAAQALRHEIGNLRITRDSLLQEKSDLDEKWQKEKDKEKEKEKEWVNADRDQCPLERELLECGETIEAIDAMIEHKNEMICGRKDFDGDQSERQKCKIMDNLSKLSEGEMRKLFYTYFLKVIDLKESSKNLELQNVQLEAYAVMQDAKIRDLTNKLKNAKLEAETKLVVLQRENEVKLNLLYRHIAEETGSSGHEGMDRNSMPSKCNYKRENMILKKRMADNDALWKRSAATEATSPPRNSKHELKQFALGAKQIGAKQTSTKVERQGRKMIWTEIRKKR